MGRLILRLTLWQRIRLILGWRIEVQIKGPHAVGDAFIVRKRRK
jgi:hypothetical protein